jgi:hypothetical protein
MRVTGKNALPSILSILIAVIGAAPALADPQPSPRPQWGNTTGFCPAGAAVAPWDASARSLARDTTSDHFFVNLWTTAAQSVVARVVLLSATDEYSIELKSSTLSPSDGPTRATQPIEIAFDHPVTLIYDYVEAASIDGAVPIACPKVIHGVYSYSRQAKSSPSRDVDAPPTQAIDTDAIAAFQGEPVQPHHYKSRTGPCMTIYQPPRLVSMNGDPSYLGSHSFPMTGPYGNRSRHAQVLAYVDAAGKVVGAMLATTSGESRIDDLATKVPAVALFDPAQFMCEPTVSTYSFWFYYQSPIAP